MWYGKDLWVGQLQGSSWLNPRGWQEWPEKAGTLEMGPRLDLMGSGGF